MIPILNLAKTARDLAEMGLTETRKRLFQGAAQVTSGADVSTDSISIHSVGSFLFINNNGEGKESNLVVESAPALVSPVTIVSNADLSCADNNIEADSDIFKQPVDFKTLDGREYSIIGLIDTGNDADCMLMSKQLAKEIGFKLEPLLVPAVLRGINGPVIIAISFVRITFRMRGLGLGWKTAIVHVVDCDIGFNIGKRAVLKFGLLGKLVEMQAAKGESSKLHYRDTSSSSVKTVNVLVQDRSQAKKEEDAKKHQENSPLAAEIATFRERWDSGACGGQNMYQSSIESYDISSTASTWSTSPTLFSVESSRQERKK